MKPNFSGYVTKANIQCSDGRTIKPGAFEHQDGMTVPLVFQHNHTDVNQVLGKVVLSHRDDGLWGDAYVNDTVSGQNADALVKHGDVDKFSIWAKNLVERGADVLKGDVQEVSLVLAGANPGATISNVLTHSGLDEDENMMVVGFEIKHAEPEAEPAAEESDKTVGEVLETLTPEQQTAVNSFIDGVVTEAVTEALTENDIKHDELSKEKEMTRNLFQQNGKSEAAVQTVKPEHVSALMHAATAGSGVSSLRDLIRSTQGAELMHAGDYGIDNIEILFPDAQALMNTPTFVDRRQEWVKTFMGGTRHSPFSRVKSVHADITADEARAQGYVKGAKKIEEVFPVLKRTTGPTTVYKKQKLDRDDIIDITSFDVVAWMKAEMRGKLDEEIARAALLGDGRSVMDEGKIKEPTGPSGDGIRSIINDNDLYTVTYNVNLGAEPDYNVLLDAVVEAKEDYRGSGNTTAFMTFRHAAKLLTMRDSFGKRIYRNLSEVAGDMDVNKIERVPTSLFPTDVLAIVVDLGDYNFGADAGGQVTLFDDFDIDFNQYKYLIEARLSGALITPFAAQVFKSTSATSSEILPTEPALVANVVTVPTQTGVVYKRTDTGATVAAASTITLNSTSLTEVTLEASTTSGYHFPSNSDAIDSWTFKYKA